MLRTLRIGERWRTSSGGFTLPELLVVMAILAAVVTLAVPFVSGLDGPRLAADAEALGEALRDVRARAMRENREAVVAIDTSAGTVAEAGGPELVQLGPEVRIGVVAAATEQIGPDTAAVRFLPDGSSTGAVLTLGRDDRRVTIEVHWFDGSVEVQSAGRF